MLTPNVSAAGQMHFPSDKQHRAEQGCSEHAAAVKQQGVYLGGGGGGLRSRKHNLRHKTGQLRKRCAGHAAHLGGGGGDGHACSDALMW